MPLTPTDPTKPQVWINGQAPNQTLDFYIPQGPKGDPGGFSVPTVLTGTGANLNNVLTPGLYTAAGSDMTYLNNWPMQNTGGILQVFQWSTTVGYVMQMFWPRGETQAAPNNKPGSRGVYVRTGAPGGLFSIWSYTAPSRVDQTAGRAMYQWDDINGREQLIYGDTGVRNVYTDQGWIDALTGSGVVLNASGLTRVRRVGQIVELVAVIDKAGSGSVTCTSAIPLGFRPAAYWNAIAITSGLGLSRVYHPGGASPIIHQSQAIQSNATFSVTYTTNDAWPTTLPGVASGSIPNT